MSRMLKEKVKEHGDQAQIIPVHRLVDAQVELENWLANSGLDQAQKQEILGTYNFNLPSLPFKINSIILVACPFPATRM